MSIVAVSLKLYFDLERTLSYCRTVAELVRPIDAVQQGNVRVAVLPTFLSLSDAWKVFASTPVLLGAQDIGPQDRGAFTGEVSGTDLKELGCAIVEIGHAERRTIFRETDELVAQKTQAAFRNGLIPLLCVGEPEHVDPRQAAAMCISQVLSALDMGSFPTEKLDETSALAFIEQLSVMEHSAPAAAEPICQQLRVCPHEIFIGYEPYWAIGAAEPAPPQHVSEVCKLIRLGLSTLVPKLSILYGGSAGPGLLTKLDGTVDGLFLGRFAHDPQALKQVILEACASA